MCWLPGRYLAVCSVLSVMIAFRLPGFAQASEQTIQSRAQTAGQQGGSQGGSATGGAFAPVLDAERRPITAGGFVKEGPIVFQDISEKAA